ncbi:MULTISPECIES: hypothetical protein [Ralstonia]|uniref:Uncharacterized protein n=2 Tax=Ralstonia TaxID=48736 RepID=A0AAD2BT57_9RALS|nr:MULTISPECIES: hypothetical protein [Ralstonia]NMV39940.1 hypothetical protein [Ralstonia insidiosa]CAJ0807625.1 hypothetical protein R77560_04602 [Ralstonia sp. LMG 18095]
MTETESVRPFGLIPIVDGPWQGGQMAHAVGTFEAEGSEIAMPWTAPSPGVNRVRYYRQQNEIGLVWSIRIPPYADALLHEEETDIQRIIG